MGNAPTPIIDRFSDDEKEHIKGLWESGLTQKQIADEYDTTRHVIMKLCKHMGLKRSHKEAATKTSPLDSPDIIEQIREMRNTHSLKEIADKVGGSQSAVQRICDKYNIEFDKEKFSENQSKRISEAWTEEKREKAKNRTISEATREKLRESSKKLWEDPEYRAKQVKAQKEYWNKKENKERLATHRAKQSGKLSSIQKILYSILDDLGLDYYREYEDQDADPQCIIGPYNFDCVIPRKDGRDILIECQGDYWHTQQKAIKLDKSKHTYINKYFNDQYELKYLWEHEFECRDKVIESIKYWTDTNHDLVDYSFDDLIIKQCNADQYKPLLIKYHYLSNAGRGGKAYGAFLNDDLIAVCVFSPLIRQNLPHDKESTRELSRLCVHPKYQRKNLASWFVSRCIKRLPDKYSTIISYCDTTFNHDGAVYKALNFVEDSKIKPDYWYVDPDGWVLHKKSLYNKAKKMSLKERQYAEKFNYKRVYGKSKIKFVYNR